jgi:hypothetical protein
MATIDATPGSSSFGRIVDISNSPYSFTEAHHCGVDKSGKVGEHPPYICSSALQRDRHQLLFIPASKLQLGSPASSGSFHSDHASCCTLLQ